MQVQRYGLQAYYLVVNWSACRTKPTGARGKETIVEMGSGFMRRNWVSWICRTKGSQARMSRKPQAAVRCLPGLSLFSGPVKAAHSVCLLNAFHRLPCL